MINRKLEVIIYDYFISNLDLLYYRDLSSNRYKEFCRVYLEKINKKGNYQISYIAKLLYIKINNSIIFNGWNDKNKYKQKIREKIYGLLIDMLNSNLINKRNGYNYIKNLIYNLEIVDLNRCEFRFNLD